MELITRTCYAAKLQTSLWIGVPVDIDANSTLNEKFNVATNIALNSTDLPHMQYLAIGNGGHRMEASGSNSVSVPVPLQHKATDAALYNHLPFILRPVSNDITAGVRENYALRKVINIDGDEYVAYYLKRMDLDSVSPVLKHVNIENNIETSTGFTPSAANLNPVPPTVITGGAVPTEGNFILATALLDFNLTPFDIEEIKNAANILYGSEDYAIISEIATCSGVDKVVGATDYLGASFNYNEVIAAQVNVHISTFHPVRFVTGGISAQYDVGATEPLYI